MLSRFVQIMLERAIALSGDIKEHYVRDLETSPS